MPIDLAALLAPSSCAVLTHELQVSVVGPGAVLGGLAAEAAKVFPAVRRLLAGARSAGVPVVHNTAGPAAVPSAPPNSPLASALARRRGEGPGGPPDPALFRVVDDIGPERGDIVLERHHGMSAFPDTELEAVLKLLGVRTIVATGVSLNVGIIALTVDAVSRGYRVVVATDAVAGATPEYGAAVIEHSLAPLATRLTVDEILAVWAGLPPRATT